MKKKHTEFIFFSLSPTGTGVSGGDRIFIELAREWAKNIPVTIYTTQEGVEMCERQQLTGNNLTINKVEKERLPSNFFIKYFYKILLGIKLGFSLRFPITHYPLSIIHLYSSSDFWMDVLPAVILKIRYPKLKWIATWYQTAPNPMRGYVEDTQGNKELRIMNYDKNTKHGSPTTHHKREYTYTFSALLYWLSQLPVKPLINKFADYVIVNNEDERKRFSEMDKKGKVIVLLGAVRLDRIKNYELRIKNKKPKKIFDCVFQGRFHPQKGVVELIDIWKKVVEVIPNAKLAMIGDGPLFKNVEERIRNYGLENNIKLFGFVFDGDQKYKIFARSKIVVHPAFYDSGGMASAEAMAFGLPCVGFDLKAYESYYPRGMMKVKVGDINAFSNTIIKLLKNEKQRSFLGKEASNMIKSNWSWEKRSNEIFSKLYEQ